jgi:NAD(P)-dependent dehydrogenase (short-subunit alcohol dehydrogenase family)
MTNSVAIVTGASQGIGRSTAVRLARDFKSIVLAARSRAKLQETAADVAAAHATPLVIDLDLSERSSAKAVVERALSTFGRIDALVNVAGAVPQIDLFEITDEQWDGGLALKLHGARRLTIEAWPAFRRSYLEHWASIHHMTVAEATEKFPRDAGIARYGEPEEIAELMAFLVSPGARWMTGSTLRMDGGEVKSI